MMPRFSLLSALTLGLQLLSLPFQTMAQDAGLFIQGGLEGATANNLTEYNTGGTITINGFNINVPKNMLVQFPAAYVPFKDFVEDVDAMLGFEVNVLGNYINGNPMAAQIIAYEFFEGENFGYIESVNFADGSMKILNGPTLRINDPNAVFSVGYTAAPFFTADDESPSVTSFSGFPMCIPRNESDPGCPATNRPFQGSGTFSVPDPLSMAPFLPGDFVVFQGIRRGGEYIAFSVVAMNVQITTLQDLVYVRTELAKLGIDSPDPNTELAESRFIGFVSNPRATVALYAMDIDPCTGEVTDRIIAAMGLRGGRNEQNKFEYRADIFTGYARDYRVVTEIDGIPKTRTSKNGFLVGTYVQPVNVWAPAEQLAPGVPPPAFDFSQMPWLTQGVGVDENGNLWGPLDPFPQTGVLIDPPACGAVSALDFMGDDVDTDWVPSSTLLNGTLPLNSTTVANTTTITHTAPETKKRGSATRWLTKARIDSYALGDNNDNMMLNQISASA